MNRRKQKKRFGGHILAGKVRCSIEEEIVSCYKMVFSEGTAFFKRVTEGSEAVSGSIILGNIVFNL